MGSSGCERLYLILSDAVDLDHFPARRSADDNAYIASCYAERFREQLYQRLVGRVVDWRSGQSYAQRSVALARNLVARRPRLNLNAEPDCGSGGGDGNSRLPKPGETSGRSLLGRRVRSASPSTRDARSLLHTLDQREQAVPLQWKRELRHYQTLNRERQRAVGDRFGAGPIQQRRAPDGEWKPQRGGIGDRERSLHDRDQRHLAPCPTMRIGHTVKHARLVPGRCERLRDALEQRVFGPNQKNDRHAFTESSRPSEDTEDDALHQCQQKPRHERRKVDGAGQRRNDSAQGTQQPFRERDGPSNPL